MGRGDGVNVRPNSIQLFFVWNGQRYRETLTVGGRPIKPTPANVNFARRTAAEIRKTIDLGTFNFGEYFPNSKHAKLLANVQTATFGQMVDAWLKTKGRLAKKTRDQYRNACEVWKAMFGAQTPMAELSHSTVAGKIGQHPWSSNKLLNNYLICLRGVFKLASRELKLDDNAVDGVINGKHQSPAPDPLSSEEMEKILNDLQKHYSVPVSAYFEFAFMTGMRPEELIALRWADIDWNHGTVRVERAKTAGQIGPLKTYQTRDVDLVERAVGALAAMKPYTFMRKAEIFLNPVTDRPWHDERSQRDHYWKPSLLRQGIRDRRAYQTRHTYAATALMGGVNPAYISRQMGHKNAKMLFTVYAKWIDKADQGRERAKLEAAQVPQKSPISDAVIGRRDWTRTNSSGNT